MVLSETNFSAGPGSARQERKARSGLPLLAFSHHAVGKRDNLDQLSLKRRKTGAQLCWIRRFVNCAG